MGSAASIPVPSAAVDELTVASAIDRPSDAIEIESDTGSQNANDKLTKEIVRLDTELSKARSALEVSNGALEDLKLHLLADRKHHLEERWKLNAQLQCDRECLTSLTFALERRNDKLTMRAASDARQMVRLRKRCDRGRLSRVVRELAQRDATSAAQLRAKDVEIMRVKEQALVWSMREQDARVVAERQVKDVLNMHRGVVDGKDAVISDLGQKVERMVEMGEHWADVVEASEARTEARATDVERTTAIATANIQDELVATKARHTHEVAVMQAHQHSQLVRRDATIEKLENELEVATAWGEELAAQLEHSKATLTQEVRLHAQHEEGWAAELETYADQAASEKYALQCKLAQIEARLRESKEKQKALEGEADLVETKLAGWRDGQYGKSDAQRADTTLCRGNWQFLRDWHCHDPACFCHRIVQDESSRGEEPMVDVSVDSESSDDIGRDYDDCETATTASDSIDTDCEMGSLNDHAFDEWMKTRRLCGVCGDLICQDSTCEARLERSNAGEQRRDPQRGSCPCGECEDPLMCEVQC